MAESCLPRVSLRIVHTYIKRKRGPIYARCAPPTPISFPRTRPCHACPVFILSLMDHPSEHTILEGANVESARQPLTKSHGDHRQKTPCGAAGFYDPNREATELVPCKMCCNTAPTCSQPSPHGQCPLCGNDCGRLTCPKSERRCQLPCLLTPF